ncbi:hypothetical protein L7F22_052395 [Adiantum nelumboides]|nr:hypothetical protein [Adiantum nelumboides]
MPPLDEGSRLLPIWRKGHQIICHLKILIGGVSHIKSPSPAILKQAARIGVPCCAAWCWWLSWRFTGKSTGSGCKPRSKQANKSMGRSHFYPRYHFPKETEQLYASQIFKLLAVLDPHIPLVELTQQFTKALHAAAETTFPHSGESGSYNEKESKPRNRLYDDECR